jgi:hypothetical protein
MGVRSLSYRLNRINPNQIQVFFADGRFETLTNEELNAFLVEMDDSENLSQEISQSDLQ